jgi:hypothetical protein
LILGGFEDIMGDESRRANNSMTTWLLILLIFYEVISAVFICRLWFRKNRIGVMEKSLLSMILILPLFGWLFYFFLKPSPTAHGEDVGTHSCGDGVGDTSHHP